MAENVENVENVIESDSHSLFVADVPEERIPLVDEQGNEIPELFQIVPAGRVYSLYLGDFRDETLHGFNKILYNLQTNPAEALEIHISSPGGYVHEGIVLYNIISSMYRERTSTYLHWGYSMGAIAFLFGDTRVVFEDSSLMIHNWSGGFYGKSKDIEDQLNHTKENLWKFFSKFINPYLNKKEIKKVERGEELWFTSRELLKKGMATHIIVDGEMIESEEYLKKFKKDGTIRKNIEKIKNH